MLTLLRLAGIPRYAAERTERHPLVVDRRRRDVRQPRAAGAVCRRHRGRRGRSARARARPRVSRGVRPRAICSRLLARERGFYVPSFYEPQYARRRHADRLSDVAAASTRRCRCARPRSRRPKRVDPPATSIFTPDTEFGSRFLVEVVRGCANLCRFCWAGYNYLPVRAFPDRPDPPARRSGARRTPTASAWCRSRSAITRTSSASSRGCTRWATRISPASLRLDDLTEPIVRMLRASGERTHHHRAGDRFGPAAPRHQQDGHQRRDPRPRRADLRERHREPEALLHDRPPHGNRRRPGGDSRPDAAAARADAEARASPAAQIGRIVGSVNPLIPKPGTAYQWLPMEDAGGDRPEDQAAAQR